MKINLAGLSSCCCGQQTPSEPLKDQSHYRDGSARRTDPQLLMYRSSSSSMNVSHNDLHSPVNVIQKYLRGCADLQWPKESTCKDRPLWQWLDERNNVHLQNTHERVFLVLILGIEEHDDEEGADCGFACGCVSSWR